MVDLGEAVGVIAAQSIGEPGTQLTLRTFHIGGIAGRIAESSKVTTKYPGKVIFKGVKYIELEEGRKAAINRDSEISIKDDKGNIRARFSVPYAATILVNDGDKVEKGTTIFEWDPYTNTILTEVGGKVAYKDIIEGVSVREELDEITGLRQMVIIEQRDKSLLPAIQIKTPGGKSKASYSVPTGAHLLVREGDAVKPGDQLVNIPRDISKTRDITGGLPRVAELFEARHPREPAIVSEIDGFVEIGKIIRGNRQIFVKDEAGEEKEYLIPHGKHIHVHEADRVRAGERLCEGAIDPHDILSIKGANAVQEYLVNEIQEVYRLQGVKINDKHIETIVRQMMQKVRVESVGDTNFLEGDQVDKHVFKDENDRVIIEGGEPATFQPLLLGITKASLSTDSFISAASFQETTRVLTEAAILGKRDNLLGLKENVIIGHLIPAGTGLDRYRKLQIQVEGQEEEPEKTAEEAETIEENA
jgi:DNA-directed RNA polymerase subunit beta'